MITNQFQAMKWELLFFTELFYSDIKRKYEYSRGNNYSLFYSNISAFFGFDKPIYYVKENAASVPVRVVRLGCLDNQGSVGMSMFLDSNKFILGMILVPIQCI